MKKIFILTAISLTVFMSGCSNVRTEKEPTLNDIKWSMSDKKIYLRTMYVQSDFKENGEKRTFNDYDFKSESSPCTVFREYSPRTNVYTIHQEKESMHFECRPYFGYDQPDIKRLYLLGSKKDCEDRTWDYKAPALDPDEFGFVDVLTMCSTKEKTKYNEYIETKYDKWFKSN